MRVEEISKHKKLLTDYIAQTIIHTKEQRQTSHGSGHGARAVCPCLETMNLNRNLIDHAPHE